MQPKRFTLLFLMPIRATYGADWRLAPLQEFDQPGTDDGIRRYQPRKATTGSVDLTKEQHNENEVG